MKSTFIVVLLLVLITACDGGKTETIEEKKSNTSLYTYKELIEVMMLGQNSEKVIFGNIEAYQFDMPDHICLVYHQQGILFVENICEQKKTLVPIEIAINIQKKSSLNNNEVLAQIIESLPLQQKKKMNLLAMN